MTCPKCQSEMDAGFLLDAAPGGARKAQWVRGADLPALQVSVFPPGLELTGERYAVTVHRCRACGYLEAYATEKA